MTWTLGQQLAGPFIAVQKLEVAGNEPTTTWLKVITADFWANDTFICHITSLH
jgi:hypothetical protein